jgi:hypothetical protein
VQQRLVAIRLFYDYLMEEGIREDVPELHAQKFGAAEHGLVAQAGEEERAAAAEDQAIRAHAPERLGLAVGLEGAMFATSSSARSSGSGKLADPVADA